jgi:hypothetical protein
MNGLQYKARLIKNNIEKMPYRINNHEKLHFELIPYKGLKGKLPLQIKHLSYSDKKSRKTKYNLYKKIYDTKKIQKSYDHFLKDNVKLCPYGDLMVYNYEIRKEFGNNIRLANLNAPQNVTSH